MALLCEWHNALQQETAITLILQYFLPAEIMTDKTNIPSQHVFHWEDHLDKPLQNTYLSAMYTPCYACDRMEVRETDDQL